MALAEVTARPLEYTVGRFRLQPCHGSFVKTALLALLKRLVENRTFICGKSCYSSRPSLLQSITNPFPGPSSRIYFNGKSLEVLPPVASTGSCLVRPPRTMRARRDALGLPLSAVRTLD